jgi:hypothetical protein
MALAQTPAFPEAEEGGGREDLYIGEITEEEKARREKELQVESFGKEFVTSGNELTAFW